MNVEEIIERFKRFIVEAESLVEVINYVNSLTPEQKLIYTSNKEIVSLYEKIDDLIEKFN